MFLGGLNMTIAVGKVTLQGSSITVTTDGGYITAVKYTNPYPVPLNLLVLKLDGDSVVERYVYELEPNSTNKELDALIGVHVFDYYGKILFPVN